MEQAPQSGGRLVRLGLSSVRVQCDLVVGVRPWLRVIVSSLVAVWAGRIGLLVATVALETGHWCLGWLSLPQCGLFNSGERQRDNRGVDMINNLFDLSNDVVAVIGATGVLGGAIAEGMAAHGARVAVMGRNPERGQARVDAIRQTGCASEFIACDASNAESLAAAVDAITTKLGAPTVLVSAAGGNDAKVTVTDDHPFEQITADDWRANFDLNLVGGALLPAQAFGPGMCQRGRGSIINIASVTSHLPLSRVVSYSAAKAAVLSLSQFLAREWATKGVRVNTITPGFFPAEQNKKLLFNEDGSPTPRAAQILGHTPMSRFGDPSELVGAAVFLAAHGASSFVTGSDIVVDGGFLHQTI